ncbi:hypothetical protein SAMN02910265_00818 [Ruminococcus flavefaciens]|uniref:EpsG family protein n=1 Tax=Ruminococcus flavefaciens TaxID=1265 RepID=A0A1H6IJ05_RUMFL|nr:hypothetical protein SAMN02910265_00818 [Ruminococcus flavefaciens]
MIYIIVFFISVSCLEIAQKFRFRGIGAKIFVPIALIVPSALAGLRDYSIGGDISAYGNYWFERACSSSDYFEYINNARSYSIYYGYSTLNFLVSRFTSNSHWFYFYLCLFELVVLFVTLLDYKDRINVPFAFAL